ncbi:MAG: G5 domain-containing protein [Anaerolineales bacterium]|nr:G5 domain-containing protein [Anaerolineales bacterium]
MGCSPPRVTQGVITIHVNADGEEHSIDVSAGVTAEDALNAAGVILGELDRADPPLYTVLSDGSIVRLIRVQEDYSVEQEVIPFEQQVLQNESLPVGEEYWLQLGKNGLKEITTRRVYEDGVEVTSNVVNSVIIEEAVPQIKMVGVQKPFTQIPIPGRLAYLLDGNVWVMEGTTGTRRQVVNTGDLDGRVFSLSPDGVWLLFTRIDEAEDTINTLWAAKVDDDEGLEIDLEAANIVHFADWKPGSVQVVAYSTVEPRSAAPGWQANNDLQLLTFSDSGYVRHLPTIVETNLGGLYGWWGTDYIWAPDGLRLAYARPDSIGIVDVQTGEQTPVLEFLPLQTYGDWAWVPGVAWGPDGKVLFSEIHFTP